MVYNNTNLIKSIYEFYALLIKKAYNSKYLFVINRVVKLSREYSFREVSNEEPVLVMLLKKYSYNNAVINIYFEHIKESLLIISK